MRILGQPGPDEGLERSERILDGPGPDARGTLTG
jgi:hypothetical protein